MPISRCSGHAVSVAEHPTETDAAELDREWQLLRQIDPIARDLLAAADAWDAYTVANRATEILVDDLTWMLHGGQLYVAWEELADLFAIGETPLEARTTFCDRQRLSG